MEEYLQYTKTLRSQINVVEDQATKLSVEEQMLLTAVHILHADLALAKSELLKVKGEWEQISKEKGDIYFRLLNKQKKIACLDSDSWMVSKRLELIQQEKTSLSAKLTEKGTYCTMVAEDVYSEFQKLKAEYSPVKPHEVVSESKEQNKVDKANKILASEPQSAKEKKTSVAVETATIRQRLEQMKGREDDCPQQSKAMDVGSLEEEHESLLADISAKADFLQPLENQKEKLEGISQVINCPCGEQYKVELKHAYTETAGGYLEKD